MRKGCLACLAVFAVLITAVTCWSNRTGIFSEANYERIRPGMTLAEVEHLLGGPGVEVSEPELPRTVDRTVPVDHPRRQKPVVSGDRYIQWKERYSFIIVSLRGDVVAEKWYWEPSL